MPRSGASVTVAVGVAITGAAGSGLLSVRAGVAADGALVEEPPRARSDAAAVRGAAGGAVLATGGAGRRAVLAAGGATGGESFRAPSSRAPAVLLGGATVSAGRARVEVPAAATESFG